MDKGGNPIKRTDGLNTDELLNCPIPVNLPDIPPAETDLP